MKQTSCLSASIDQLYWLRYFVVNNLFIVYLCLILGCQKAPEKPFSLKLNKISVQLPISLEEAITKYKLTEFQGSKFIRVNREGCEMMSVSLDKNKISYTKNSIWAFNLVYDNDIMPVESLKVIIEDKLKIKAKTENIIGLRVYTFYVNDKVKIALLKWSSDALFGGGQCQFRKSQNFGIANYATTVVYICHDLSEEELVQYIASSGQRIKKDWD